MSKAGQKILKGLHQALEMVVHPGRQPILIADKCIILSVESYEQLKGAALRDRISKMNDTQLQRLVERQIKAASKVLRSKLPRCIGSKTSAGVTFNEGFDDAISEALIAAKLVNTDDLCGND